MLSRFMASRVRPFRGLKIAWPLSRRISNTLLGDYENSNRRDVYMTCKLWEPWRVRKVNLVWHMQRRQRRACSSRGQIQITIW